MRLFDCTLRDGANVVGNGFSKELTISIVEALLDCGINQSELGNAKGIGAHENGAEVPLSDLEYMQTVAPYVKKAPLACSYRLDTQRKKECGWLRKTVCSF